MANLLVGDMEQKMSKHSQMILVSSSKASTKSKRSSAKNKWERLGSYFEILIGFHLPTSTAWCIIWPSLSI